MYPQPIYQQPMGVPQQHLQHFWGAQPQTPQQTMMQPPSLQQQQHALAVSSPQMPYGLHQQHVLSPHQLPAQAPAPVNAAPPAPPPPPARLHPPAPPPPPVAAAGRSEQQDEEAGGTHLQPHEHLCILRLSRFVLKWYAQKSWWIYICTCSDLLAAIRNASKKDGLRKVDRKKEESAQDTRGSLLEEITSGCGRTRPLTIGMTTCRSACGSCKHNYCDVRPRAC
jgi:hypothetical protein